MTKEELIGRKFQHRISKDIYQIFKGKGDKIDLKELVNGIPTSEEFKGMYTLDEALSYIQTGTKDWQLIEEPITKMYKTSKGIEYGVGTKFVTDYSYDNGNNYEIVEITDKQVTITWAEDGNSKHYYPFETFRENLDNWKIVFINSKPVMKDYNQVDPKTIKFDFTQTKIAVGNPEENKWVQEVAIANGYKWSGPGAVVFDYALDKKQLFFDGVSGKGRIGHGSDVEYFNSKTNLKEITIQDILNNMKEVIEVGDTVIYPEGICKGETYVVKELGYRGKDLDTRITYTTGSYEALDRVKLHKKGNKKEIIGYETVVDLPGIPKGTQSTIIQAAGSSTYTFNNVYGYKEEQVKDTKFFKPIYKQDVLEIKFSKYTATLSKEHGLVFTDGERMELGSLKNLLKGLETPINYGGFKVTVVPALVQVGCKSFTAADVKLVSEAVTKLQ